jgi:hypothetical protein
MLITPPGSLHIYARFSAGILSDINADTVKDIPASPMHRSASINGIEFLDLEMLKGVGFHTACASATDFVEAVLS